LWCCMFLFRRQQYYISDDEDDEKRVVRSQKDKRSGGITFELRMLVIVWGFCLAGTMN